MEPPQNFDSLFHSGRRKKTALEHRFAQARDFSVFVDLAQTFPMQGCNLQPNGVGSNINRSKSGHGGDSVYSGTGRVCRIAHSLLMRWRRETEDVDSAGGGLSQVH